MHKQLFILHSWDIFLQMIHYIICVYMYIYACTRVSQRTIIYSFLLPLWYGYKGSNSGCHACRKCLYQLNRLTGLRACFLKKQIKTSEEDNFVGLFLPQLWVLFSDKSLCKEESNKKISMRQKNDWRLRLFLSIKPKRVNKRSQFSSSIIQTHNTVINN